jgi:hypothetical protein
MWWMTPFRKRLRQFEAAPERGATAVMVGMLMVGLVGFTGLAVDGGATYAKHKELQNGADAAALAAAQECADIEDDGEIQCPTYATQVEAVAGPYGEANVRKDTDTVATSFGFPEPGQVRATVTGTRFHWFMPVVGISESELSADAIAEWGNPISGPAMLPFTVSQCTFEQSLHAGEGIVEIFIPKNRGVDDDRDCDYGEDYPPGSFGWLADAAGRQVQVAVDDWVDTNTGLNDKPDCNWQDFIDKVVFIPIFDEDLGQGASGEVHVTAFAALRVLGLYIQTGNEQYGEPCGTSEDTKYEHKTCLRAEFIKYTSTADGYEVGNPDTDTELRIVRLID